MTQLIGVGGVIPTKICEWSPFLAQLQSKPDPMGFAQKSFIAMQVVVYIATVGAGGRKYRFHFPRYVRYVDFFPFF